MSPRKRSNKGQDSNKNAQTVDSQPKDADSSETGENTEEYPRFQPSIYSRRRPSDGVRWFPVVKRIFYVSLLVLVPMILNYAALNHEMRVLPPKGDHNIICNFHSTERNFVCFAKRKDGCDITLVQMVLCAECRAN